MIKLNKRIAISTPKIAFSVVIGMHLILAFINPVSIFQLLSIIIIIFLFSSSLITLIFNLSPVFLSFLKRVTNILPAIILLMLTSIAIFENTLRPIFNTEIIYISLILTLLIIGVIEIVFAYVNTGFPKWHRSINILIGLFSIFLSLITIVVSILGFVFLTIVICALFSIDKTQVFEIF